MIPIFKYCRYDKLSHHQNYGKIFLILKFFFFILTLHLNAFISFFFFFVRLSPSFSLSFSVLFMFLTSCHFWSSGDFNGLRMPIYYWRFHFRLEISSLISYSLEVITGGFDFVLGEILWIFLVFNGSGFDFILEVHPHYIWISNPWFLLSSSSLCESFLSLYILSLILIWNHEVFS